MSRPGVRQGGMQPIPVADRFWDKVDASDEAADNARRSVA